MKQNNRPRLLTKEFQPLTLVLFVVGILVTIAGCSILSSKALLIPDLETIVLSGDSGGSASSSETRSTGGYIPLSLGSPEDQSAPVPTPGPPLPAPTVVVAVPPIDFEAAKADAQAQGLDLAFTKVGFHTGPGGNASGLGEYFIKLNQAGVPIFLKAVDAAGPMKELQDIMKDNEAAGRDVAHILVFRSSDPYYEAPFYNLALSPEDAAATSWQLNRDAVPSELEKEYIWLETLNEPGRYDNFGNLQIERLARFSLETAKLAVSEGYRYAAFGFSTGVPEPQDWEDPAMLEFLRFAGENPDEVALALHEYSLTTTCIAPPCSDPNSYIIYPYLIGRFQALFDICDKHGIPRPTVLITEWGWEHNAVPEPIPGIEDIAWASWLYAAFPQVKGAAIWYLGGGDQFGNIANDAQKLIAPLADYAVSHYFIYHPGIGQIDPDLFRPDPPTFTGFEWENLPAPYPRPRIEP